MKKALWIVALAVLVSVLTLHGQSITVNSPIAGNEWPVGATRTITWTSAGVSGPLSIKLRLANEPNVPPVLEIAASTANDGSYSWTIPESVPAGDYWVRVRTVSADPIVNGDSANFKIVAALPPPPAPVMLQLEAPNGGESFVLHHDCTISWKSIAPAMVGKVELLLMRFNCCTIGVIKDNLPSTGSFTWKAGEYPGNLAPAGKYLVRVRSMTDPKIYDESDDAFELKSLTALVSKIQKMNVLKGETVPGVYQNFPCSDTFPGKLSPPVALSVFQQGWQQMFGSSCGIGNTTAKVGAYWFPYYQFQAASLYRSRILFYLSKYADKAGALRSAKLRMKRLHSVHEDANSGCGCGENLWVLEAPMTTSRIPAIGQRIDVSLGTTEFTRDVTEIVRQWLNGSQANNGLLLLANELPCSGGRKCASCYEASLILTWK